VRGGGKKMKKSEGKFHGKNKYVYNDDLAWLIILTCNPANKHCALVIYDLLMGKKGQKKEA
jgi:hypothetical protein